MARRDTSRRSAPRRRGNGFARFFLAIGLFILGYFTATWYDYAHLRSWFNQHVAKNQRSQAPRAVPRPRVAKSPPKFEFYTLLAKDNRAPARAAAAPAPVASQPVVLPKPAALTAPHAVIAEAKPIPLPVPMSSKSEQFVIQVAAFNQMQDAQRIKAGLLLKGYNVFIMTAVQGRTSWYRVMIGPFANQQDAGKAKQQLARQERLHGMLRRA